MKRIALTIIVILLVFSAYLNAETIKLADGTIIQGTVVSGDEKGVEIKLIRNNATVNFAWNQLADKDRMEIRKRYGLEMPDYDLSITVTGDRIETFSGEAYVGKIETDTEDATRVYIYWLDEEGVKERKRVARQNIRDIYRNISIPAYILMPKEEVYELILEQHPPVSANDHYLLAMYCREIGFYEKGLEHVESAIEIDPDLAKTAAELKAKFEKLISAKEFSDTIKSVEVDIKKKKLTKAYMDILALQADEKVKEDDDLKNILSEVIIQWELKASEVVSREWFAAIKSYANKAARDREMDLNGARQYALGQMDKDIQDHIIEILHKDKDVTFSTSSPSPINAKLIGELFKKRDKKSYSPLKITINAEAFRIKLSGTTNNSQNNNTTEDPIQQLKDAYEKYRSGEMTDEEKEEFLKKYGKYFKGSNQGSRSIDPEYLEPLQQSGRVVGRDSNGRIVREPSTGGNNTGGNNTTGGTTNGTTTKQLTLAEVWAQASSSARRTYIIYLYCKRKKEIILQSEKMKNTTYYAWFN